MVYRQLTQEQRYLIYKLLKAGYKQIRIAESFAAMSTDAAIGPRWLTAWRWLGVIYRDGRWC